MDKYRIDLAYGKTYIWSKECQAYLYHCNLDTQEGQRVKALMSAPKNPNPPQVIPDPSVAIPDAHIIEILEKEIEETKKELERTQLEIEKVDEELSLNSDPKISAKFPGK